MSVLDKGSNIDPAKEQPPDEELEIIRSLLNGPADRHHLDQLAKQLVARFGDAFSVIFADEAELRMVPGVSAALLRKLKQTRHLLDRLMLSEISDRPLLDNLDDVTRFCRSILSRKQREEFHVLFLDGCYHLLGHECLQTGTLDHVMVYPRELMHRALANHASHLILVHNHPFGPAEPSRQDIRMTNLLTRAGKFLNVSILDHIIIGHGETFSFRRGGLLDQSARTERIEPLKQCSKA